MSEGNRRKTKDECIGSASILDSHQPCNIRLESREENCLHADNVHSFPVEMPLVLDTTTVGSFGEIDFGKQRFQVGKIFMEAGRFVRDRGKDQSCRGHVAPELCSLLPIISMKLLSCHIWDR